VTYDDWMRRTRAGALQPRSAALRNLDAALKAYTRSPSQQTFNTLKAMFDVWQKGKSDWDTSIRNKSGAVSDLNRYLAAGWPRPAAPPIMPKGPFKGDPFRAAAALGRKRAQLAEQQEFMFRRDVTQTLTYRPGSWYNRWDGNGWVLSQYTTATNVTFPWTVKLGFLNRGPVIEVRVRIRTIPKAGVSTGASFTEKFQNGFKTQIQSYWNCGTIKDGKAKKDLLFSVVFTDDADAYQLNVANPPPVPQGLSRQAVAQLSRDNTINLLEWAWNDRTAILHEFGHMVGCPDEYLTTGFTGMGLTWSADIYDQIAYTTGAIMNDPTETALLYPRNFALVLDGYKEWQRSLGADPSGATIVIERARLPAENLTIAEAAYQRRMAMGYFNDDEDEDW